MGARRLLILFIMRRRAKIVATLGPASSDEAVVDGLVEAGVDCFRLNFSHGDHEGHGRAITTVRAVARRRGRAVAIMQDLQGPRIRVGSLGEGALELVRGESVLVAPAATRGSGSRAIPIDWGGLDVRLEEGDRLLIDDGLVEVRIREAAPQPGLYRAEVVTGGAVKSRKGVNLPGVKLSGPAVTDRDRADLAFGIAAGVDMVTLSFVGSAADMKRLRGLVDGLLPAGADPPWLVAKIERAEALADLDAIVEAADAVMVARGDLGIEIPLERVPLVQKEIIRRCVTAGKPVITATQMLESMTRNARPTRAEVTDVAQAVMDGTDALMLSAETSTGTRPVEAVRIMARIIEEVEASPYGKTAAAGTDTNRHREVTALARAADELARLTEARAIVTMTLGGSNARLLARLRPDRQIWAFTPNERTQRRLSLIWGVRAKLLSGLDTTTDAFMETVTERLRADGDVRKGDRVVIIASHPMREVGQSSHMNTVKIEEI
ncbi:MAG TPA: pyruvate kinase [Deltaproteobacteria bacterium]|nr:pyruvate kinase [Deltaproteobacteria bacterium]